MYSGCMIVKYTDTQTFKNHEALITNEISSLEAEFKSLGGVPGMGGKRQAIRSTLRTRHSWIEGINSLSSSYFTLWDLIHILADAEGTLWTPNEARLWHVELANYEGRGEKSIRTRLGLHDGPTTDTCDLAEINEEVKNWQGAAHSSGKPRIQSIRVGEIGKKAYGRLQRDIVRSNGNDIMSDEFWDALACGEVSPGKLYNSMPEAIRSRLLTELAPSKVMSCYDAVNGVTELGYVRIPREDYDRAWRLNCITQMSPKYDVRVDYIKQRLMKTLSDVKAVA